MRIAILTNEYPPYVYGGAGVHVEYLTRELARLDDGTAPRGRAVLRRSGRADRDPARRRHSGRRRDSRAGPAARETVRHDAARPDHERQAVGHRRRALPHVVHAPRGLRGEVPAGGAARPDDAFARAAPAVEGGAARHGVSRLDLDRANRVPERRRRRGGLDVDEARRARALRCSARSDPRDPQRHRSGPVPAAARSGAARRVRHRAGRPVRALRRADHAAEGHHSPGQCDPALPHRRAGRVVRRSAGHAGDRRRDGGGGRARARRAARTGSCGFARCCRRRR